MSVQERHAVAIDIWENEGGALEQDAMDHHYGRRVEMDQSWTVYHVFTGVPATVGSYLMTDLSRSGATSGMLSLNLRNEGRRREHIKLSLPRRLTHEIDAA